MENKMDEDYERNQRERKQTYLKNEVIAKGYNKSDFATFMNSLKENGTDIDLWTFDELVGAVETFQKSQSQTNLISEGEESSEEDDMFRYLHPSEQAKIKERKRKAKLEFRASTLPLSNIVSKDSEKDQKLPKNSLDDLASNDQGGWEQDSVDIQFLNMDSNEEEKQEASQIDDSKAAHKPKSDKKVGKNAHKNKAK